MDMTDSPLLVAHHGRVGHLRLNRPRALEVGICCWPRRVLP